MVRAVDIEGFLQKYVEDNSLERADASTMGSLRMPIQTW